MIKGHEVRLVIEGLERIRDWDEYQEILCFLRLWRREYDG